MLSASSSLIEFYPSYTSEPGLLPLILPILRLLLLLVQCLLTNPYSITTVSRVERAPAYDVMSGRRPWAPTSGGCGGSGDSGKRMLSRLSGQSRTNNSIYVRVFGL